MVGVLVYIVDDKGEIYVYVFVRLLVVFFFYVCSVYCVGYYRERYNVVWNVIFLYIILLKGVLFWLSMVAFILLFENIIVIFYDWKFFIWEVINNKYFYIFISYLDILLVISIY